MDFLLNELYNLILGIINSSTIYGPLFACLLIFLESILPVLPLFVFITIVIIAYGYGFGFLVSYTLTCLGCLFSFFLCRTFFRKFFIKHLRKYHGLDKAMKKIDKLHFSSLVLLIAIPFTPAFLINIASSLSNMTYKKFIIAILIGKVSLVFFWGFIGTSLLESLKNPKIMIVIIIMLLIAYAFSKLINKKLNIE